VIAKSGVLLRLRLCCRSVTPLYICHQTVQVRTRTSVETGKVTSANDRGVVFSGDCFSEFQVERSAANCGGEGKGEERSGLPPLWFQMERICASGGSATVHFTLNNAVVIS